METINQLRADIVAAGVELLKKGLVAGTWGNISARCSQTGLVAITPSGRSYTTLTPDDIIILDKCGNIHEGRWTPSTELPLHLAVYKARPDVQAVVHTHSIFASACAVARKAIPPILEELVQVVGGAVEVAAYAAPGTECLAQNAVAALGRKNAVLLANHGDIGCGQSLREAMLACELVEKAAQIYIYANQLGGAAILSEADVADMHEFYRAHYSRRQEGKE